MASIRAGYAASGVNLGRNADRCHGDTAGKLELAIQDAKWQSDAEATKYRMPPRWSGISRISTGLTCSWPIRAKLAKMGQQLNMDEAYFSAFRVCSSRWYASFVVWDSYFRRRNSL